jgi:D-apionolactonase
MSADPFLLYGTRKREEPARRLKAGRLVADLVDGNLRTIRYDGVEVLRAISYIVRDRDWGTHSPRIDDLVVEETTKGFTVTYRASCEGPENTSLGFEVRIAASETELSFEASALSTTGFETNRCGFCILHPIVGVAGSPVSVEHVDGSIDETHLPDLIEPWQPFKDMRAITHPVMPGVTAECRMEGDTFEMEDQRNWSDASYKTYVRPLALPWPYQIEANQPVEQKITLKIRDTRATEGAAAPPSGETITITPGTRTGRMPNIGLVIRPEDAQSTLAAVDLLSEIGPQELLFHFDPLAGHGDAALRDFAEIARLHRGSTVLEIALPCIQSPAEECKAIAAAMQVAGFRPDSIMISPAIDRQSTPPGSEWPECPPSEEILAAARAAFTGIRIGGGMLSYFTELNRKRIPPDLLDFVSHCTNPIVHAADDLSVMQTLEALPFITRSVRAIYGDKPYRIGPSTIPMRQNPYGSRTMENPDGGRIAMANRDPRHNGRFAEAFALGYAIRVLDAGLECLTLSALTGPFGLVADAGEPHSAGSDRPLAEAVRLFAASAGGTWSEIISSAPSQVLAFATNTREGAELHLVNLSAEEKRVDISALQERAKALIALVPFGRVSLNFGLTIES